MFPLNEGDIGEYFTNASGIRYNLTLAEYSKKIINIPNFTIYDYSFYPDASIQDELNMKKRAHLICKETSETICRALTSKLEIPGTVISYLCDDKIFGRSSKSRLRLFKRWSQIILEMPHINSLTFSVQIAKDNWLNGGILYNNTLSNCDDVISEIGGIFGFDFKHGETEVVVPLEVEDSK